VKLPVLEATAAAGEPKVKPELEIKLELEIKPAAGDGAAAVAGARAGASSVACGAAVSHAKHFACSQGFGTWHLSPLHILSARGLAPVGSTAHFTPA
jgi:hypothetical protein